MANSAPFRMPFQVAGRRPWWQCLLRRRMPVLVRITIRNNRKQSTYDIEAEVGPGEVRMTEGALHAAHVVVDTALAQMAEHLNERAMEEARRAR